MKRHKDDPVLRLIHTVDIRNQGNLFQELGETRLIRALPVGDRLIDQFLDIFQSGLGFHLALFLQLFPVSGLFKDRLDHIFDRFLFPQHLSEFTDLIRKHADL